MDTKTLIEHYPRLFHMAEADTWPKIKKLGLLSTKAALDHYGITGAARKQYEADHRPEKMVVGPNGDQIVLRDQKPMTPSRLAKALQGGLTPQQWYKWLNSKVFFWAEEHRLLGLLGARAYRDLEHDVITIDTAKLMKDYEEKVWLCHMNSGNTFPMAFPRDLNTFCRIPVYPTKKSGAPLKPVVEVVVDNDVQSLRKYAIEVRRMKDGKKPVQLPL